MKKYLDLVIITLLIFMVVVAIVVILPSGDKLYKYYSINNQAQFVGKYLNSENKYLSENINKYYENGYRVGDGYNKLFCTNKLYGYDDRYAYTWIFCNSFGKDIDGNIKVIMGFSTPVRFEYDTNNFKILNDLQPDSGGMYDKSLRKMFPIDVYRKTILSIEEQNKMTEEFEKIVKAKYLESLNSL